MATEPLRCFGGALHGQRHSSKYNVLNYIEADTSGMSWNIQDIQPIKAKTTIYSLQKFVCGNKVIKVWIKC